MLVKILKRCLPNNLEILDVGSARMSLQNLKRLAEGLKGNDGTRGLRQVALTDKQATFSQISAFTEETNAWPRDMRHIDLSSNNIKIESILGGLLLHRSLVTLNLSNNPLKNHTYIMKRLIKINKYLSIINLSKTGLKMVDATEIMETALMHPNLRRVDLSRNDLSVAD